ncbi:ATP-binding protein [Branchiibius sp. NY16-3462-2]|uniref:sensor histidine kinase n=1 Tax=Branchiibius sp. NY16-3462-2 TaxID=1807500 RepID=UPI0025C39134|nr:ATP-binding protein [Branchiibius sp. NY16-3462-2]
MELVLVAIGFLAVGGVLGALVARSRRPRPVPSRAVSDVDQVLPPASEDVLAVLPDVYVIVDASDAVRRSSTNASALGLIRSGELAHPVLRELVRTVRRENAVRDLDLDVPRGPFGHERLSIGVRAGVLDQGFVLLLIEDRTQSRRVDETRRDFLVNVSHELKTPVAGMTLLSEAIDEARDDPEAVHRFSVRLRSESVRLSRLVQEIIELSRLQVSENLEQPVLVDVESCVREAMDHLRMVAQDREITVAFSPSGERPTVYGDQHLLTTAVRNLVENAISYSDPGTRVTVTVQADADLVSILVKDQGSGIPAADLDRIFERFYRVDAARSRRTGGTGLGLAIVKHICANHGGEVSVWSEEGQGSTFTIRIPAAHAPDEPQRHESPQEATA